MIKYVLILFGLSVFISCKNDLEDIKRVFSEEDTLIEIAKDVEIFYSDSAEVKVRITGPTMLRNLSKSDPHDRFPDGIEVDFYDSGGNISGHLTAKQAIRYELQSKIIVRDSVVWESANDEKLESEELIWNEKTQKVYTNKFVTIRRPDEIIQGYGFEANQDFSHSRIKVVEGRLKISDQVID